MSDLKIDIEKEMKTLFEHYRQRDSIKKMFGPNHSVLQVIDKKIQMSEKFIGHLQKKQSTG